MRFSAAILFTIYLLSFTEMHELFRLPYLIEHYTVHRQSTGCLNVFSFLLAHYGGAPHGAQHSHERLPFEQGHCVNFGHAVHVNIPESFNTSFDRFAGIQLQHSVEQPSFVYTEYHFSIWQPPRV